MESPLNKMPRHVAIIMDGNGRWAKQRKLPREEGHRQGVENVKRIVECAKEIDLQHLTLYAFSVENWNRPKLEVNALMHLLESFLKSQKQDLIKKQIRFRVFGQIDALPQRVARLLHQTMEDTAGFDQWNLNLALNYGARTELMDAVQSYVRALEAGQEMVDNLSWERFQHYLYTTSIPDPDLVIRTSGEFRVSNFLLLQSAYAEYYFSDIFWPDFGPEAFKEAIDAYGKRERRFGMTGDQLNKKSLS